MKIAITGNIGSGKSTFSGFAVQAGFPVLFADDISKNILENDEKVRSLVIKSFGAESFIKNKPNKKFLAEQIFSDQNKREKLESILHPRVIKSIDNSIKDLLKSKKAVFVEAALIYESDMEEMFDYVVLVTANRELRLKRKFESGISEEDFCKRELNQIPEEEKKKRADFIFSNDTSIEDLKTKFNLLLLTLGIK
ncbi:MAG: dephospho-CoA kinase [Ignavibacteriales bacterium]|nr:dephospho-CoA kinase [Ignavibacteriales bacterium]